MYSPSGLQRHAARRFGRRQPFLVDLPAARAASLPAIADDAKLFLTTFAGGFLFMAVYLA